MFKSRHKKRSKQVIKSHSMQMNASVEANTVIKSIVSHHLKLKSRLDSYKFTDRTFRLYTPVYYGLRVTSRLALLQNLLLIIRRMALLYVAMFLPDLLWLQLLTLLCSSLLQLAYLFYVKPFESKFHDRLNKINEFIMLLVVYHVICVAVFQDSSFEAGYIIGLFIVKLIWTSWLVNGLVVVYLVVAEIYKKLRRVYLKRVKANKMKR